MKTPTGLIPWFSKTEGNTVGVLGTGVPRLVCASSFFFWGDNPPSSFAPVFLILLRVFRRTCHILCEA